MALKLIMPKLKRLYRIEQRNSIFGDDSVIDIIGTDALNPFIGPKIEIPSWIKNNAGW